MDLHQISFSIADFLLMALYFIGILYIGFFVARRRSASGISSTEDFILAGRGVTLPIFVGTLVATWYGNILGIGEFIYNDGIVAWVCFAFPYYIAAGFFAGFIAKKIRTSNVKTIPEQMFNAYGRNASVVASVIVLIITIPAAYILILGVLIQVFIGLELWICIIFGTVLSMAFLFTGGFRADILTNSAQFVIMYIGFAVLLFYTVSHFGSVELMLSSLPERHLELTGGYGWQFVMVWFIISFQTFVDPGFHQRCAAAKTPEIARRGIIISIICWMIFDFLTLSTGLYAAAYIDTANPMMSYPLLADVVLPYFWKGLFFVTLLATVMSTLDSYAFISGITIGNDILKPMKHRISLIKELSTKELTRVGLAITSIIGIVISILLPSAVQIIYKTASIAVPGLLFPLLITYSKRFTIDPAKITLVMLSSSLVSAIWTIANTIAYKRSFMLSEIFIIIEPMVPGILVSLILSIIFVKKQVGRSDVECV
jgi:solute:Na+ symporter, SSS family